jgi:hypothetical protein
MLVGLEQRFLNHIFRVFAIPEDPEYGPVN